MPEIGVRQSMVHRADAAKSTTATARTAAEQVAHDPAGGGASLPAARHLLPQDDDSDGGFSSPLVELDSVGAPGLRQ